MNKHLSTRLFFPILLMALLLTAGMRTQFGPATAQTTLHSNTITEITQTEHDALVALYNATNGDDWIINTDWLETNTPCNWYGVTCSSGQVVTLTLPQNNLVGQIPPEINHLSALETLDLSSNQLSALPSQFGSLSSLMHLALHQNPFSGELPSFLTQLTQLDEFTFYDTDWCMPLTGEVPAWLGGISVVYGTGRVCGLDPASLSGTAILQDATFPAGVQVNLYRSLMSRWRHSGTTYVAADGTYQFTGLGQGLGIDYRVWFVDPAHQLTPQYYGATTTISTATVITITPGVPRTGVDVILARPSPPIVEMETSTGSVIYGYDGTAQITMPVANRSDLLVTRSVTCMTGTPISVTLDLSTGPTHVMAHVGGNLYQGNVPAVDFSGDLSLSVTAYCAATTLETVVGWFLLYDRASIITDARTGRPVAGASITLYQVPGWLPRTDAEDDRPNTCESNLSKPGGVAWSQPAPTHLGIIANSDVAPTVPPLPYQRSTPAGSYGWDGDEGCWYVIVEAQGYLPLVSPMIGIPPQVVDLNLALEPRSVFLPLVVH